jgi:hypothetical protein
LQVQQDANPPVKLKKKGSLLARQHFREHRDVLRSKLICRLIGFSPPAYQGLSLVVGKGPEVAA